MEVPMKSVKNEQGIYEEEMETASKRKFLVNIRSRDGLSKPVSRIVIVEAFSVKKAVKEAIRKMRHGHYKNRTDACWIIESCEAVANEQA